MRSGLTNSRVFVFPARTWAIMENTLFQKFSTGAEVILQEMGRTYGRQFGSRLGDSKITMGETWKLARDLARNAGWGDLTIEGGDRSPLFLTIHDCVFCSEVGHLELHSCQFLVGMALGLGDEMFGRQAKATETRCMRAGADACVIELRSS